VAVVGQATKSGFDVVPTPFVLEAASNEFGDERAASAWARPPIELVHEIGIQRYVQTHGPEGSRVRTRRPFGSRSGFLSELLQRRLSRRRCPAARGDVIRQRFQERTFLGTRIRQLDQGLHSRAKSAWCFRPRSSR